MKVLVLGGNGFVGRNIVARLQNKNIAVLVGGRKPVTTGDVLIRMENANNGGLVAHAARR